MNTMDFETFSELPIECGSTAYASHKSTEILCLKYRLDGGDYQLWSPYFPDVFGVECPEDLSTAIKNSEMFEAHNAGFEQAVWYYQLVKKLKWPQIPLEQWQCSAAKAAHLSLPRSLDGLGEALQLAVRKDLEGYALMMKMCKPRTPTKNNPSTRHFDHAMFLRLAEYCERDVETEELSSSKMPNLPPKERQIWELDQEINMRGFRIDVELAKTMQAFCERYKKERQERLIELTDGRVTTGGQRERILKEIRSYGVEIENLQAETIVSELQADHPADVLELLQLRQDLGKSSTAKLETALNAVTYSGRICDAFLYQGADRTGRWAGKGFQPHNLPRNYIGTSEDVENCIEDLQLLEYEDFKAAHPDVLKSVSSCLRGLICAGPGKELLAGDFSAIEGRVLAWLAGEESVLEVYRGDGRMYEVAAGHIYNMKPSEVGPKSDERQIGKVAELALGFGGGKGAFLSMAKNYGVVVSEERAEEIKVAWREGRPKTVQFWEDLNEAAASAIKTKGKVFKCGKLKLVCKPPYLMIKLPSGRNLYYYRPQIRPKKTPWGENRDTITYMGVHSKMKKFMRLHTYGGKLAENVTQAVARDFLADSMIRVNEAGHRIVLHVHDEIVIEQDVGDVSLQEFLDTMKIVPEWGGDCPIDVGGWQGPRFKKD